MDVVDLSRHEEVGPLAGSKERERRRARERYEQQRAVRQARQQRIRKRLGIGLVVVCVLGLIGGLTFAFASGVGGSPKATSKPTATASASASATASPSASASASTIAEPAQHCTYTATAKGASVPPAAPDYQAAYSASINTGLGKIGINLLNSKATCAVNSFVHLASANFWNNSQCHRLSTTGGLYMLQCGDPTAKGSQTLSCSSTTIGTGGPGYEFASENLAGVPAVAGSSGQEATYPAGTVAMANSGSANSNGSQFFLVYKATTLPPDYTPFGTITSGLDILQKVAKAGTSCTYSGAGGGVPKEKVVINSVTVKKS
jgi:peptidyl-prolyl cis-trans isomerase B (cyclophilin B)